MKTMRLLKIMLIPLVLGGLAAPLSSCSSEPEGAELLENQIATVQRGNITIDITAAGNLALSRTEDLAIELFYGQSGSTGTKGTVGEVLVEEGDSVEEGQVLVTLDKDEWDDQLSTLEDQVTTKERDLVQTQINLLTAEQTLKNAQDNEATKKLAVLNAQISLDTAQNNLDAAITATDYQSAQAALKKAKVFYEYVVSRSKDATDGEDYLLLLERAKEQLDAAQIQYDLALSGYNTATVALRKKQVEAAEMSLAQAQEDLTKVATDVALKEQDLALKQGIVTDAQKALADAQKKLAEAQSKSPEITAPFAGFITKVNVAGGDEVLNGTVAVQLADPNKFEANILVSEMDILQVKLEGEARVSVDALSGVSFPAKVTRIAPTATIQSGVVNYTVKVEIQSLEAVALEQPATSQQAMPDIASVELPEPLQKAIEEGRLTREQAEEMMKQGPPSGMTPPTEIQGASGQEKAATSQVSAASPEDYQLREGLTVTVSIIVSEKSNVLLVPNAAITGEGGQNYVQVVSPSGTTEKRAIQTGITDYQYTEVTSGLSEGEKVMVPQGTATKSTTSQQGPQGGISFFGPPPR